MSHGRLCGAPRDGPPGCTWPPSSPGRDPAPPRLPALPGVISGDDVYVAEYFSEELLADEPADDVRSCCGPPSWTGCPARCATPSWRRRDPSARLREAARRNLFVVPAGRVDREPRWYRYHRLFREMLLAELRLREPGEEPSSARRAAAWFDDQDLPDEAIPHALAGGDHAPGRPARRPDRATGLRGRAAHRGAAWFRRAGRRGARRVPASRDHRGMELGVQRRPEPGPELPSCRP